MLSIDIQHHVATLTLQRPEVRNAFNEELIAKLTQAFIDLNQSNEVRVVVLAAAGDVFCAGADLHWMRRMSQYSHADNRTDAAALAHLFEVMAACPVPILGAVQGDVYAGGMGLVSLCDMVVACEKAWFCLSEVKIGLIPATISPYVVRAMGYRAAQRYALTAERFDATTAHRLGFIHEVVPNNEALQAQITAWSQALIMASPQAIQQCKRLLNDVHQTPIDATLIAKTIELIADIRVSHEGQEGVQAFLQKRRPSWQSS